VTGYGGWSWVSKTHVPRFLPKLPGNTNPHYRLELEGRGAHTHTHTHTPSLCVCFQYLC